MPAHGPFESLLRSERRLLTVQEAEMKTLFCRWTSVTLLVAVALSASASAQQPAAALPVEQTQESPAFEVAVLRKSERNPYGSGRSPYGSGRWSVDSMNLGQLLHYAFDLQRSIHPIVGLPDWARSEVFSFAGKAEDGVILNRDTLRPRLRRFLEERFKLTTHFETRQVKGYALVVAKGGPKLKSSSIKEDLNTLTAIGSGRLRNPSVTMDSFVKALEGLLQLELGEAMAVVNETDVAGHYDVSLEFAPLADLGRLPRETNS